MIKSKGFKLYQLIINIILILVTLSTVIPLVLLFMSSISSESSLIAHGYSFLPKEFSLEAYAYIWQNRGTIFRAYGITILITIFGTLGNVGLSSMMAFALTNRKLPFRRIISFYIFFTMLFSGGLVPSYIMWTSTFHIKNTIWALLLPNFFLSPMNVMLIRTYFVTSIPEPLYEAAEIDGAGYFTVFRKVVLPLGKPILVTMGLFSGLTYWNDWTNGLYYITNSKLYSIQTLLNKMIQDIQAIQANAAASSGAAVAIPQVSIRMAIAFVAVLPILIIYPFLQKYFAQGIALGAVKG
ncbi:putative aldouronate transport system permease protein [Anaerocolumna jejuensis DSM 15929]|uniref:Putative aldouronate transport system permease protein n=1 Tax=Anaerocolumna jejuensis DSM 15929 TaxID=1121322 RepID=A0A1M6UCS9_9FIRM|nr:carbohydrate ABC transporter permease [Anaerocolumna jejuensis]SHK66858.1 putative aldouronate transport system permease protein [Anaerocolumna jejuensis DSM 15929]